MASFERGALLDPPGSSCLVPSAAEDNVAEPSFIAELQRRRVFRVLVGYGVVSFAVLQIVEPIQHALGLSDAVLKIVVVLLALGFPVALVLAWAFDVNAGGIERTAPTGAPRATMLALAGAGLLIAAPGVAWVFFGRGAAPADPRATPAADAELKARLDAVAPGSDIRSPPSIAVLPLVNMSSDKEQEYFSDGLSEELLNLLAKVPGLQVAARTSAFSFKGKNIKIGEIGRELGVATVLEGSVRKSGDQVRITTQLINTADGFHLWSETYDRKLTEVFAVQDEIARAVVAALKLKLLPAQAEARAVNPEAYNQFLLGLHFLREGSTEGRRRALEVLEKTVALDPGFARGWAALARARFENGDQNAAQYPPARFFPLALEAAEKAIALAPSEAAGWEQRALIRMLVGNDWAGARRDLELANALAPGDAQVLIVYSMLQSTLGQLPQAIAMLRKATAADPLRGGPWSELAIFQLGTGEFAEAEANAARSVQLSPDCSRCLRTLGFARLLQHKLDEAKAAFESVKDDGASGTVYRQMGAALVAQERGDGAQASRLLAEMIGKAFAAGASYQIAEVFAWRGETGRAFEWLDRAWKQRDAGLRYLKIDPLLRKVRGDPRYAALLRKQKLPPD